ncbi:carbohydrate kinase [Modestobacter sp. I12A-02628]|uniref:Carbohydrate kinase n=1 Tax=Goekera deserti TaxID=2497753 RepID=A0A7K3W7P8_9ACTN|nr:FGGY family carbohydrate kinase [Goekera deserti]MPQ99879.1 carbohydrate kinase [Goekera deserti]NDI50038.1 carbohydrate kinase [Goekera deserti]NEL52485.1 carbohydrate kinase [Goekera deserti]
MTSGPDPSRDVVLGADLGTSGLKLAALDGDGAVVAEAEVGYDVDTPAPGWAQTEVATWRAALDRALAEVAPALTGHRVAGLGLSGQMHGAVLVDDAGTALAPALLWPDQRAADQVRRWQVLPEADRAALANPLVPGMTGPLTAWLAEHEPELLARAATVLLPKDALRATLVPGADQAVTDRSDASATLLWDVPADTWSAAALHLAGLGSDQVPTVRPGSDVVGVAVLAGTEVPVVVGAADTPLALLAAGTGTGVQVNLGTGAQLLRPGLRPAAVPDPLVHSYADADGGWYAMAALQNAGLAWSWVRSVLGLSWTEFLAALGSSPAGAGGVVFRPFLTGERGGVAGPADRGGWAGLHPGATRDDLARAALEGVVLAIDAALRLLPDDDAGTVVLTGGGGRSPAVQQLLADVLGRPVRHVQVRSASATGAAALAARGTGTAFTPQRTLGPLVEPGTGGPWDDVRARWSVG